MRVLVTGGRNLNDRNMIYQVLDIFHHKHGITVLIHGAATGADTLAQEWAFLNSIPVCSFPVTKEEWDRLGKRAGPLRNERMLKVGRPDALVAFPGGRGTANMVQQAKAENLKLWEVQRL